MKRVAIGAVVAAAVVLLSAAALSRCSSSGVEAGRPPPSESAQDSRVGAELRRERGASGRATSAQRSELTDEAAVGVAERADKRPYQFVVLSEATRQPLEGVRWRLVSKTGEEREYVWADQRGSFELEQPAAGRTLEVLAPSRAKRFYDSVSVVVPEHPSGEGPIEITLPARHGLWECDVRVVGLNADHSWTPLEGAHLFVQSPKLYRTHHQTDERGYVKLNLPQLEGGGTWTVTAVAAGWTMAIAEVAQVPDADAVIELQPTDALVDVRVRVMTRSGDPLVGARLSVTPIDGVHEALERLAGDHDATHLLKETFHTWKEILDRPDGRPITDALGVAVVPGVPRAPVNFLVRHGSLSIKHAARVDELTSEVVIKLDQLQPSSGRVLVQGRALPGVRVRSADGSSGWTACDEDGRFDDLLLGSDDRKVEIAVSRTCYVKRDISGPGVLGDLHVDDVRSVRVVMKRGDGSTVEKGVLDFSSLPGGRQFIPFTGGEAEVWFTGDPQMLLVTPHDAQERWVLSSPIDPLSDAWRVELLQKQ